MENGMSIILAIDDDSSVLKLIDLQLSRAGYSVITASSGKTGLDMARTGSPTLILLDIFMPDMDGFSVLRALQQEEVTARIPVIMISAQSEKNAVINAMRLGVSDYIVKPYEITSLLHKISSVIAFSSMEKLAMEDKNIALKILRGAGRTIIVFDANLRNARLLDDAKRTFNRSFLTMTVRDELVFDLRSVPTLTGEDIPVLRALISLFPEKKVHIVAGRHYGDIVADSSIGFDDAVHLYISPGDMELELSAR
jgi:CheY-like chemotaxis protein